MFSQPKQPLHHVCIMFHFSPLERPVKRKSGWDLRAKASLLQLGSCHHLQKFYKYSYLRIAIFLYIYYMLYFILYYIFIIVYYIVILFYIFIIIYIYILYCILLYIIYHILLCIIYYIKLYIIL